MHGRRTHDRLRRSTALGAALIVALGLSGCEGTPSKAGADTGSISLSVLPFTSNALVGDITARLVKTVPEQSGGEVVLKQAPVLYAGATDGSSDAIAAVRSGKVDVAVVSARSFDLLGATSLQALSVPLAVDSPAQAVAFLADPVAQDMLDGLKESGVVGLALAYQQMNQPLGFSHPVLDPRDLHGSTVLVRPNRAAESIVKGLGATPDDRNGADAEAAISTKKVTAAISSMDRPSGFQSGPERSTSSVTGNVQLGISASVVIVNASTWAGLTEKQQQLLRRSAEEAGTWAGTQAIRLDKGASAFCAAHIGDVVLASKAQLGHWRAAVAPIVADLSRSDVTAAALARMAQIVAEHPTDDTPATCAAAPINTPVSLPPAGDQTVLAGQWRLEVKAEDLAATGATHADAVVNQGTWTFTIRADGTYFYLEPYGRRCPGRYVINQDRLSMTGDPSAPECQGWWAFTWTRNADALRLVPTPEFAVESGGLVGFFTNSLTRIGDAPRP